MESCPPWHLNTPAQIKRLIIKKTHLGDAVVINFILVVFKGFFNRNYKHAWLYSVIIPVWVSNIKSPQSHQNNPLYPVIYKAVHGDAIVKGNIHFAMQQFVLFFQGLNMVLLAVIKPNLFQILLAKEILGPA